MHLPSDHRRDDGPRGGRSGRPVLAAATTIALLLPAGAAAAAPVPAQEPAGVLAGHQVTSPDGSIETNVDVVDGTLTYEVVRDGSTTVVAPCVCWPRTWP